MSVPPLNTDLQVDAIAGVPGVDVLLVGPSDLGNSIGHPIIDGVMHDELISGIQRILEAARRRGKHACMYCSSGPDAKTWLERGFQMVCFYMFNHLRAPG